MDLITFRPGYDPLIDAIRSDPLRLAIAVTDDAARRDVWRDDP
ncbi:hypothetical protein [Pseudomonas sp. GX19020]|nr:hypothetical protein [Pseudomonas sp. GX19020]